MSAFGGESPLSDAPSSNSPTRSTGTGSPVKPPSPPPKNLQKKKPQTESASSSRRSSRIEDRSASPEKPSAPNTSLKIKFTRPPSPEKLSEITEEAAQTEIEEKGKRGKKRKSETWAEEEVREAIGNGKGKKKVKVSHGGEEEEPKKKNVAIKKKSSGGVGPEQRSASDMISDFLGDNDEEGERDEEEVKEKDVVKPVIKIKGKPGRKPKIEQDVEGDVKMENDEVIVEKPSKSSKSKARRREEEEFKPEAEPTAAPSKSTSKRTKRDTTDDATIPTEVATEMEPAVKAPKAKGRPKKTIDAELPSTSTTVSNSTAKEGKKVEPAAPEVDMDISKGKTSAEAVKPKKSFAQVVAGSPPPSSLEKREKKPLPTITKLNKSIPGSTPDKRFPTGSGSGTGPNTPTIAKKLPVPPQKKKEVSLLESTMASLLGGGTKPTPKKEEKEIPKSTPKPILKERTKGSWADEWVLTPTQQREVMESRDEREEERRRRMLYRRNPVNLQEAKDSYRLDSTKTRVIPSLPYPHGGLGVKTEGAPSMMLRALIERNTQSRSLEQAQSQSV